MFPLKDSHLLPSYFLQFNFQNVTNKHPDYVHHFLGTAFVLYSKSLQQSSQGCHEGVNKSLKFKDVGERQDLSWHLITVAFFYR